MGVERVATAGGPTRGGLTRVVVGGVAVCVARTRDGRLFAVADRCSHREVPLSGGSLSGTRIECPLHAAAFDLATGEPTGPPASTPIPTYRVVEDGDDLLIDLETEAARGNQPRPRHTRWWTR